MTRHEIVVDWLGRPLLNNEMNRLTWPVRAKRRKEWRDAGYMAALHYKLKPVSSIGLDILCRYPTKASLPDPDGCAPAVKGLIDGLVDRRIIPDDTGEHVRWLCYWPPFVDRGPPALCLALEEDPGVRDRPRRPSNLFHLP